jgi:hypothetical protein
LLGGPRSTSLRLGGVTVVAAHGTLADSHIVANGIGGIVATHDVSGFRVGSSRNCMTIAA